MDRDITGLPVEPNIQDLRVDHELRESYRKVFFGLAEPADKRRVFCDLLAQTNFLSTSMTTGETPEASEAKRGVGLYLLTVVGLAPSTKEDIFESLREMTRLFSANQNANELKRRKQHD